MRIRLFSRHFCPRVFYRTFIFALALIADVSCKSNESKHESEPAKDQTQTYDLSVRGAIVPRTGGSLFKRDLRELEAEGTCELLNSAFTTLSTAPFSINGLYQFAPVESSTLVDRVTTPSSNAVAIFVRCHVTVSGNPRILMSVVAMPLDSAQEQSDANNGLQVDLNATTTAQTLILFGGQDIDPLTAASADALSYPPSLISGSSEVYTLSEFVAALDVAAQATDNAEEDTITSPIAESLNEYIQSVQGYINGDTETFAATDLPSQTQVNVAALIEVLSTLASVPEVATLNQTSPAAFNNTVLALVQASDDAQLTELAANPNYVAMLASVVSTMTTNATTNNQSQSNVATLAAVLLTPEVLSAVIDSPAVVDVVVAVANEVMTQSDTLDLAYIAVVGDAVSASIAEPEFIDLLTSSDNTPSSPGIDNFLSFIDIVSTVVQDTTIDTSGLNWQDILGTADLENTDYSAPNAEETYAEDIQNSIEDAGCAVDSDTDLDDVADCMDGCPNDGDKTSAGVCGCGVADTDSDDDDSPDCIDDPSPMVTLVTSPLDDGTYESGQELIVTVVFSEPVTVSGTPALTLDFYSGDRTALYYSGSGTSVLSFRYTVQSSDFTTDLNYAATDSLTVAESSILDSAENAAIVTLPDTSSPLSLGGSHTIAINRAFDAQAYIKAANAEAGDLFGLSVAISGDTAVVGAYAEDSNQTFVTNGSTASSDNSISNSGAAYIYVRSGNSWSQQAFLKAPNAGGDDVAGYFVAISGDTVLVAAHGEDSSQSTITNGDTGGGMDDSAQASGAVFIFVRSGSSWSQQAYLKVPIVTSYDVLGKALALDGDTAVVGAPGETGSSNGAAYVFVRSGTTWSQQASLSAANADLEDRFGCAVAINSDTVVVGACNEDSDQSTITNDNTGSSNNSASNSGAAYVFLRSAGTWSQQAYLKAPNAEADDAFGSAVAISDDTVVVGAPNEDSAQTIVTIGETASTDNSASNSGAAYVFLRNDTTWLHQAYLKASNAGGSDYFGAAVSISGDTVLVGATGEDSNQTVVSNGETASSDDSAADSGATYVFMRSGATWSQRAYLKAANAGSHDYFGNAVAISEGTVLVGAHGEDSNQTSITNGSTASSDDSAGDSGAAYVFTY